MLESAMSPGLIFTERHSQEKQLIKNSSFIREITSVFNLGTISTIFDEKVENLID